MSVCVPVIHVRLYVCLYVCLYAPPCACVCVWVRELEECCVVPFSVRPCCPDTSLSATPSQASLYFAQNVYFLRDVLKQMENEAG